MFGNVDFKTEPTESCHLNWTRSDGGNFVGGNYGWLAALYIVGLLLPLLLMLPRREGITLFVAGVGIALAAQYFYGKDNSFSSMWCFLVLFYVLVLAYVHYRNKR